MDRGMQDLSDVEFLRQIKSTVGAQVGLAEACRMLGWEHDYNRVWRRLRDIGYEVKTSHRVVRRKPREETD